MRVKNFQLDAQYIDEFDEEYIYYLRKTHQLIPNKKEIKKIIGELNG